MAIGSLVFALPHFLVDTYRASSGQLDVCQADEIATVAGKSVRNKVKRNAPLAINSNSITFHYFPARGTKGKGRGLFVDRLPLYSRAITARSGCGTSLHAGRHIHRRECVQENVFDLLGWVLLSERKGPLFQRTASTVSKSVAVDWSAIKDQFFHKSATHTKHRFHNPPVTLSATLNLYVDKYLDWLYSDSLRIYWSRTEAVHVTNNNKFIDFWHLFINFQASTTLSRLLDRLAGMWSVDSCWTSTRTWPWILWGEFCILTNISYPWGPTFVYVMMWLLGVILCWRLPFKRVGVRQICAWGESSKYTRPLNPCYRNNLLLLEIRISHTDHQHHHRGP